MIYLIDDKIERQQVEYKRHYSRFKKFSHLYASISTLKEYRSQSDKILCIGNIIMLHDSFAKDFLIVEQSELNAFLKDDKSMLVLFGGSISQCCREGNKAWLPVDIFYQNLDTFFFQYESSPVQNTTDLIDYLFYGNHPETEHALSRTLKNNVITFIQKATENNGAQHLEIGEKKILYFYDTDTQRGYRDIFAEATVVDINFHPPKGYATLLKSVKSIKYDRIFIPLCFGYSLSDYNGLQLALQIRCTDSPNRKTPVFIYGPFEIRSLIANKFSGVLRLSNVHHIKFSANGFADGLLLTVNDDLSDITFQDEIKKVRLQLPENYDDEHSLANEYGVLVFARAAGMEDELSYEFKQLEDNIYYKWLLSAHTPFSSKHDEKKTQLFQPERTNLPGVRVVGKITLS